MIIQTTSKHPKSRKPNPFLNFYSLQKTRPFQPFHSQTPLSSEFHPSLFFRLAIYFSTSKSREDVKKITIFSPLLTTTTQSSPLIFSCSGMHFKPLNFSSPINHTNHLKFHQHSSRNPSLNHTTILRKSKILISNQKPTNLQIHSSNPTFSKVT